jgi:hypothetical protein
LDVIPQGGKEIVGGGDIQQLNVNFELGCEHTLDPINTRPKLLHAIQIGGVLLQNSPLQ